MIMVASNRRSVQAPRGSKSIPNRFTFAILEGCAFDLRRSCCHSPGEISGEGIRTLAFPRLFEVEGTCRSVGVFAGNGRGGCRQLQTARRFLRRSTDLVRGFRFLLHGVPIQIGVRPTHISSGCERGIVILVRCPFSHRSHSQLVIIQCHATGVVCGSTALVGWSLRTAPHSSLSRCRCRG